MGLLLRAAPDVVSNGGEKSECVVSCFAEIAGFG